MTPRSEIRFLLNGTGVTLPEVGASQTLLDFLRLNRRLTGTKEGCAEGDCGACTVLVGRLTGEGLRYEPVNACIRFLATLDVCHVVTVEHLRGADGGLHPVQEAMVAHHGSQCGFCTPGIVMSLYALWMEVSDPAPAQMAYRLLPHLSYTDDHGCFIFQSIKNRTGQINGRRADGDGFGRNRGLRTYPLGHGKRLVETTM